MPSGQGAIRSCLFCGHQARSDSIRRHMATMHPGPKVLASLPAGFVRVAGRPNIISTERTSKTDLIAFCYGCNKLMKSKNKSFAPFETHVCLEPRKRNKKDSDDEDGPAPAPVQAAPRPPPPAPAAAPVKQRSVISFLKKYQKTFKNFNITEWEEKMREKFGDFGDDSDEEEFDEFGDFLLPMIQELVSGYNKSSHQHDALEEYRIHKIQLESEIDQLKEENQELREIIEEQESDKITYAD